MWVVWTMNSCGLCGRENNTHKIVIEDNKMKMVESDTCKVCTRAIAAFDVEELFYLEYSMNLGHLFHVEDDVVKMREKLKNEIECMQTIVKARDYVNMRIVENEL